MIALIKQLKNFKAVILFFVVSSIFSGHALGNYTHYYDGIVKAVHVIEKGTQTVCPEESCVLIQIEDISNTSGTQCDSDDLRYMAFKLNNDSGSAMMSMAIAAMVSGKRVRSHANGCEGVWTSTTYKASDLNWLKIVN